MGKNLDKEVLVCPVCYSMRVELFLGGYAGAIYHCLDCGYVGPLVLKMKLSEYIKLKEELMKNKKS